MRNELTNAGISVLILEARSQPLLSSSPRLTLTCICQLQLSLYTSYPELSFLIPPSSPITLSADSPQRHLHDDKRARTDRHSPQQSRSQTPPETHNTILLESLRKCIPHALIPLLSPKLIRLHSRLDDIERI